MARYLVIHTPTAELESVSKPADLIGLATRSLNGTIGASWVRTWSPDLHDNRQFTLWDADNAAEIKAMMEAYGFLPDADAEIFRVHDWGPEDVISGAHEAE